MIIRVLHEGQYELDQGHAEALRGADDSLDAALEAGDEATYRSILDRLLALVRQGRRLDDAELRRSDVVIPSADLTFEEARTLLNQGKV